MSAVSAVSTPTPYAADEEPDELRLRYVEPSSKKGVESGDLTNHGGKVLTSVDVAPVYVGAYWSTKAGTQDRKHNDAALADLVKNKGMNGVWKQYGVGPGTTSASLQLPSSARKMSQTQIESLLKQQIAKGKLDTSNPQRVFTFVLPPGCELTSQGASSRDGLGGFHGSVSVGGKQIYYAAIAYAKDGNGIAFTDNPMDNVSIAESHEVTEAATDPDVEVAGRTGDSSKLAWYDDTTVWADGFGEHQGKGEVGDITVLNAEQKDGTVNTAWGRSDGFAFQKEWSNEDGESELAPKKR